MIAGPVWGSVLQCQRSWPQPKWRVRCLQTEHPGTPLIVPFLITAPPLSMLSSSIIILPWWQSVSSSCFHICSSIFCPQWWNGHDPFELYFSFTSLYSTAQNFRVSLYLILGSSMILLPVTMPLHPWRICSKTSNGCLKSWIKPNPVYTVLYFIHTYL